MYMSMCVCMHIYLGIWEGHNLKAFKKQSGSDGLIKAKIHFISLELGSFLPLEIVLLVSYRHRGRKTSGNGL